MKVRLFEYCGNNLRLESVFNDNIMSLYLRTKDDYVLTGDLMRSMCLLLYHANIHNFEVVSLSLLFHLSLVICWITVRH